ncbi:DUF202 domain-containing protein [Streptomyces peucetius]|uniref:DUF202 domain-containing protein n=1 Tax=Streptomyces peucetius TaxID=1950 RepID=A0ABY6I5K3_STRPE|nr:DUF202 domain-containing protein [Streptomyces peucetius]UYQ61267.1 DUF202 domain-containing protein [Streptomyces peucetius]
MTAPARDPGLQPERTRLAWRRTTLTCTVVAVLAARQAAQDTVLAAALSVVAWLGFLAVAHRRIGSMDRARPPAMSLGGAIAAVVCVLALAGFAVAIVV